jgi:hypothetical protein
VATHHQQRLAGPAEAQGQVGFAFGEAEVRVVRHQLDQDLRLLVAQARQQRRDEVVAEGLGRGQPHHPRDPALPPQQHALGG